MANSLRDCYDYEDGPWADDKVLYAYYLNSGLRYAFYPSEPHGTTAFQMFGYDKARRLQSTTSAAGGFSYNYTNAGTLVRRISLPNGASIFNTFDSVGRIESTTLKSSGGGILNLHNYVNNTAGQRTRQTRTAEDYVVYDYNPSGELLSALGFTNGGALRLHEQFRYTYDNAGNLSNRVENLFTNTFNVNNLNQLTTGSRSGTLTVAGSYQGSPTSLTVNGSAANRYADGSFASPGHALVNGTNTFVAVATDALRSSTNISQVYAPVTRSFNYDVNGNLLFDGVRHLSYTNDNQLALIVISNTCKSEFTYDCKMRRRIRKEFTWSGGGWVQTNEVRYVYDGNLVIQERNASNVPKVTYTRGTDLSGTLEGLPHERKRPTLFPNPPFWTGVAAQTQEIAPILSRGKGGIGGLLARTENKSPYSLKPATHFYYHADANSNITMLVDSQQAVATNN